jgi:hypothetical protein
MVIIVVLKLIKKINKLPLEEQFKKYCRNKLLTKINKHFKSYKESG